MGRVRSGKVKVMKVSTTSDADVKDLQKMFSQITGSSDAEREVLVPKITKIYKNLSEYTKLYNILLGNEAFTKQFSEYSFWFDDIKTFLESLKTSTNLDVTRKYSSEQSDFHTMEDKKLNDFYKSLKENTAMKKIIITSSNLAPYKKHLSAEAMDDVFIKREPGIILQPLAFTTLDLKLIWSIEGFSEKAKTFVLSILRRSYTIGMELYDIITSPDVDIKKFSKILVDSIAKMKKQIPRCDKAFAIIENSVQMLEENFKSYFRGSVEAGNPSIIIESFIIDISTSQKAGPSVTNEFRRIVSFLKEKGAQNTDPKVKKLFGMLNSQFSSMDSELGVKPVPSEEAIIEDPASDAISVPVEAPPAYVSVSEDVKEVAEVNGIDAENTVDSVTTAVENITL